MEVSRHGHLGAFYSNVQTLWRFSWKKTPDCKLYLFKHVSCLQHPDHVGVSLRCGIVHLTAAVLLNDGCWRIFGRLYLAKAQYLHAW